MSGHLFLEKIRAALIAQRLVAEGESVVLAVSGGADSVAMLHAFRHLASEWRLKLWVAHLNHMLRGAESDGDAAFTAALSGALGITAIIEQCDVAGERQRRRISLQEAARDARYRFLADAARRAGGGKIAVAHTADDQAETVMMNLLRGSGLSGLAGMPPRRGQIIRPLLHCTRAEIERYLRENNITFRSDRSNDKPVYLRNRLRLELLPELARAYNHNIKEHLCQLAALAREEDEFLEAAMRRHFAECFTAETEEVVFTADARQVRALPLAMQRRLVREAVRRVKGSLRSVTLRHVDAVLRFFAQRANGGKMLCLPGSMYVFQAGETVVFSRNPAAAPRIQSVTGSPLRIMLAIPGVTKIPRMGLQFKAEVVDASQATWQEQAATRACLDFEKTGGVVYSRFFASGDRFVPLGMTGGKKLKAFFIDAKVPRAERRSIPLLTTPNDDIVWVFGQRINHNYRVTAQTRQILLLEGAPL